MSHLPRLDAICCYPVKGMTGQPLTDTLLTAGRGLPMDRLLGLSGGVIPATADPNGWIPSEALLRLSLTLSVILVFPGAAA